MKMQLKMNHLIKLSELSRYGYPITDYPIEYYRRKCVIICKSRKELMNKFEQYMQDKRDEEFKNPDTNDCCKDALLDILSKYNGDSINIGNIISEFMGDKYIDLMEHELTDSMWEYLIMKNMYKITIDKIPLLPYLFKNEYDRKGIEIYKQFKLTSKDIISEFSRIPYMDIKKNILDYCAEWDLLIENNIYKITIEGMSLLSYSIENNIRRFKQFNPDIKDLLIFGKDNKSPLHYLCINKCTNIISKYKFKQEHFLLSKNNNLPAVYYLYSNNCKEFLSKYKFKKEVFTSFDNRGESILTRACRTNSPYVFTLHKFTIDDLRLNVWKMSMLFTLCQYGYINIIKKCYLNKKDFLMMDKYGRSPLYYLCRHSYTDIIKLFDFKRKDFLSIDTHGNPLLYHLCNLKNTRIVKDYGFIREDFLMPNKENKSPLYSLCKHGGNEQLYVINLINFKKTDFLIPTKKENSKRGDETALLWLCYGGNVKLIIKYKFTLKDLTKLNIRNESALFWLCEGKNTHDKSIFTIIKKYKFEKNDFLIKPYNGKSALFYLYKYKCKNILALYNFKRRYNFKEDILYY